MRDFFDDYAWTYGCGTCLGLLFFAICISALFAWIVMLLWNWLAPLFWHAAPILTFWQTWGIMFLLTIIGNALFKNNNRSIRD